MTTTLLNKYFYLLAIGLLLCCASSGVQAQGAADPPAVGKLYTHMLQAKTDSARILSMDRLAFYYQRVEVDSALKYWNKALDLAKQRNYRSLEARMLAGMSGLMEHEGRYAEAFEMLFESLEMAEAGNSAYDIARANRRISGIYFQLENYPRAVAYLQKALDVDSASGLPDKVAIDHYALANAYEQWNKLDSATLHVDTAIRHKQLLKTLMQTVYTIKGHILQKQGDYEGAGHYFNYAWAEAQASNDLIAYSDICADFSSLFNTRGLNDSAIAYALKGFNFGKKIAYKKGILRNSNLLATLYDSAQPALALHYYKIAVSTKDSLYGVSSTQAILDLLSREEARQKQLQEAKTTYQNNLQRYGLLAGLAALLIIAFILLRNNRQKQKANTVLSQQKEKIETTLEELKLTQAQLIQSEKMASLGQLTAGIAHEIQNPLNFVNNFSEINNELIEEVKRETGDVKKENLQDLLNDIFQNNEKITQHGKRADAIVKGMLEHSRQGTGQKQLTDINALADEYLELAYHGMQAKDKNFNVVLTTNFDATIGPINIIPQDIGRVLLNIYNNALYNAPLPPEWGFKEPQSIHIPTVWVTTKKEAGKVWITIKDNGPGIPGAMIDKIFQPFFTTKPTGQGTGLGLSLAYDIVKAHGGEINAKNEENGGATFTVQLPVS